MKQRRSTAVIKPVITGMAATVVTIAGLGSPASATGAPAAAVEASPPVVATDVLAVTHAQNPRVTAGASWTQHYFPSADGSETELHADVLLPQGLSPGQRVPVVLSVGPYFGHSGQLSLEGHPSAGPSSRYDELITEGGLLERGYALVRVDSRGFGGSSGCHDLAGPGEQADVQAAIDWAAAQAWSTGAVGMYGKSYDATTALVGNNLDQDALRAVVAMEPIWDPVTNFRSEGIPRSTIINVSQTYSTIASLPQLPDDDPRYRANAAWELSNPQCYLDIANGYATGDEGGTYWSLRDLPAQAEGSDTPLFITQGFLEWNTEAQSMQTYLSNHDGPERGWLGQWDHVSGNDRLPDGTLAMGREGWFEEVMDFYDLNLKGLTSEAGSPGFAVQDSTGTWRTQDSWPAADRDVTLELPGAIYLDNGLRSSVATTPAATGTPASQAPTVVTDPASSFLTRSEPLGQDARMTGTPQVRLRSNDRGDVMVRLYDVAPDGSAVMVNQQVARLTQEQTSLELRSTDWVLRAGHALAVEIGTIQPAIDPRAEDWLPTSTSETINVRDVQLDLALDDPSDDVQVHGGPAAYLTEYLAKYTTTLSDTTPSFTLPAPHN